MSSGEINWTKRNRMLDGLYGMNPCKGRTPKLVTQKQYDYIMDMINELEEHGVPAKWLLEDGDIRYSTNAITIARTLRLMKQKHGLFDKETVTEYVNLCRHKETGKKIKYRTTKYCGHPVGYEFLGMLYKEIKVIETA